MFFDETIVALATPPGVGAIGVLRLSGNKAIEIADAIFRGKQLSEQAGHTAHFGAIYDEQGAWVDEVLVTIFKAPKSYTGEDSVEISCHGSPYILQRVLELTTLKGARMAKQGEFTLRAFLNGKMDLSQAEAVADLIASQSEQSHTLAMQQMRGGFSVQIKELRQELIDFASLIELELDFGEEDVEFADRQELKDLVLRIQSVIQRLMDSFHLGNVLKNGVTTVIAGRPNAGKSTLLNALLNDQRAIVSEIPGTTRDTIEESININGIQFRLIDTAGIRAAQDQIEQMGIEKTIEKINHSSVVLYVFDVTTSTPEALWQDVDLFLQASRALTAKSTHLFIANKMDIHPYASPESYYREGLIGPDNLLTASAKHGMNIEALKNLLFERVVDDPSMMDQTIVSNSRHYDALRRAHLSLQAVLNSMNTAITGDFIAMDIRQALHQLAEITGEVSTDDLLESIFSRFCIGK